MKIIRLRDAGGIIKGIGLQWGKPSSLSIQNLQGVRLAVILNYGEATIQAAIPEELREDRVYLPVCEQCHTQHASLWCRSHCLYTCTECAPVLHLGCVFWSISAKTAQDTGVTNGRILQRV